MTLSIIAQNDQLGDIIPDFKPDNLIEYYNNWQLTTDFDNVYSEYCQSTENPLEQSQFVIMVMTNHARKLGCFDERNYEDLFDDFDELESESN